MSLVPPDPAAKPELDSGGTCTPEHCFHAFDALYCALTSGAKPITPRFADDKYPLFVTWNTRSSRPGRAPRLRGCIGSFEALTLHEGLQEFALISAFRDHRFRKIDKSELESLECAISLLTDFEDAESYLDWTIGVHGISITFPHPSLLPTSSGTPSPLSSSTYLPRVTSRQTFSATYLPDVIPEQGWDRIEAVDSAIQKAGWNGTITEDLRRSVKLRRYQSKVCTVGWDEYREWREKRTTADEA
ncbi:AMMECR1 domain-containing protein [Roridomyces roridus]|uniref:AMMECR1 domain-containing protein n=1 Tax=Roridomyces roridus TaxID=1738132 RepID=A0AAD7FTK6_9AGAR|nr:AMMECR1 domain-containing protein [Roridomyces roridus]